jgi:hypothetical protein
MSARFVCATTTSGGGGPVRTRPIVIPMHPNLVVRFTALPARAALPLRRDGGWSNGKLFKPGWRVRLCRRGRLRLGQCGGSPCALGSRGWLVRAHIIIMLARFRELAREPPVDRRAQLRA